MSSMTAAQMSERMGSAFQGLGGAVRMSVPDFVESETKIPGVRSEYWLNGSKVQFHFWAEPSFSADFEAAIRKGLKGFPDGAILVEYVPEVKSWYAHVTGLPVGINQFMIERIVQKIATATEQ